MLPSNEISEYLDRVVVKYFFELIKKKKHPKVPNLGAFSTFFFKKGEKIPNLIKLWCILDPIFFSNFIFEDGSVA